MTGRWLVATAPFILLVPVLRHVPLPPADAAPLPWAHAAAHATLLLLLLAAHTWCYASWQPTAPGRVLLNELLARAWFAVYGAIVVGRATDLGSAFLLVALPWAGLAWEVHRQELRKAGRYGPASNLANWGLYLLGLGLMQMAAVRLAGPA